MSTFSIVDFENARIDGLTPGCRHKQTRIAGPTPPGRSHTSDRADASNPPQSRSNVGNSNEIRDHRHQGDELPSDSAVGSEQFSERAGDPRVNDDAANQQGQQDDEPSGDSDIDSERHRELACSSGNETDI